MSSKGITKLCTHLHPPPSTSTQLISTSTQLSATPSTIFKSKILHVIGQFPQIKVEKTNVVHFDWKLTRDIVEVLISNPELGFWNFDPKIHFWPNLGPKTQSCLLYLKIGAHSISRMLIPNPHLNFWNFDPKIQFWPNLGPNIQSCLFCLKIGTHSISRMLISNSDLDFWNVDTKIHFWTNLAPKSRSCLFCLKFDTHGIWRMLILIAT